MQSDSFAISGYEPSFAALCAIGRILVAERQNKYVAYAGGVSIGFTHFSALVLVDPSGSWEHFADRPGRIVVRAAFAGGSD